MKKVIMLAAVVAALASCQSKANKAAEAEADSLSIEMAPITEVTEVYEGTLPAADGPGIDYVLTLNADVYKRQLSTRDLHIQIEMEENQTELEGVTVTASPFRRDIESPVSLRIIGLQEIEKSPGANRDISRIVPVSYTHLLSVL